MKTRAMRASGQNALNNAPVARFDMEVLVGLILLGGVLLSLALVVTGVVWRWVTTGHPGFDYSIAGADLFGFIVQDIRQLAAKEMRPRLLVNLGIAALMLTPYLRVAASMVYFAFAERNWKYTVFTGFVFSLLTYSLLLR
jgi:uncharacterized membrane protein